MASQAGNVPTFEKEQLETEWRSIRLDCLQRGSATTTRSHMNLAAGIRSEDGLRAITAYMARQNVAKSLSEFVKEVDPDGSRWNSIRQLFPLKGSEGSPSKASQQSHGFFTTLVPNDEPMVIAELIQFYRDKMLEKIKLAVKCTYDELRFNCSSFVADQLTFQLVLLVLVVSKVVEISVLGGEKMVKLLVDGDAEVKGGNQAGESSVVFGGYVETASMMSQAGAPAGLPTTKATGFEWPTPDRAPSAPSTTVEVSKKMADLNVMDADLMEVDD